MSLWESRIGAGGRCDAPIETARAIQADTEENDDRHPNYNRSMYCSFTPFERVVAGERIRGKIAASKQRSEAETPTKVGPFLAR